MLVKAMKYNWKSTYKIILLLNVYVLISTLIGVITLSAGVWNSSSEGITGLGAILFILYMLSVAFVSSVVIIYLAVRFYRNIYSDEGYLIHTLPISKNELLLSQVIVGTIHTLITTVIMLICIFGLMFFLFACLDSKTQAALSLTYDPNMMNDLESAFAEYFVMKVILIILYFIFSSAHAVLLAFASISLGQLFTKHKILGSVICYIGLYTVIQIATSLIVLPFMGLSLFGNVSLTQLLNCGILVEAIFAIVCCAVFYFLCYYLLSKKLNLD